MAHDSAQEKKWYTANGYYADEETIRIRRKKAEADRREEAKKRRRAQKRGKQMEFLIPILFSIGLLIASVVSLIINLM